MIWTKAEDKRLVELVNQHITKDSKRPVQWKEMKPMQNHTVAAMQTHFSKHILPYYDFNGSQYTPKKKASKKRVSTKRVKVSRSFLWGAVKVTRYE